MRKLEEKFREDTTLKYYNENATIFSATTQIVDFSITQDKFLALLQPNAYILDFGCGSGRDTKYFMEHGYRVEATDGSEELCKLASTYTGVSVKYMLFQELDEQKKYNGIWACSSILHLPKDELKNVMQRMLCALKDDGVIYTSFKYGTFWNVIVDSCKNKIHVPNGELSYIVFLQKIVDLKIELRMT